MKEHPILFNAPMVRATLADMKTQTRRPVNFGRLLPGARLPRLGNMTADDILLCYRSPFGGVGDRLWAKETWRVGAWNECDGLIAVDYKADGHCRREWLTVTNDNDGEIFNRLWRQSTDDAIRALGQRDQYAWEPGQSPCRWRPSIHMPRWAARLFLRVTGLRVERLQDISEADAIAEGCSNAAWQRCDWKHPIAPWGRSIAEQNFASLWQEIYGPDGPHSWERNPWVWVTTFEREAR